MTEVGIQLQISDVHLFHPEISQKSNQEEW